MFNHPDKFLNGCYCIHGIIMQGTAIACLLLLAVGGLARIDFTRINPTQRAIWESIFNLGNYYIGRGYHPSHGSRLPKHTSRLWSSASCNARYSCTGYRNQFPLVMSRILIHVKWSNLIRGKVTSHGVAFLFGFKHNKVRTMNIHFKLSTFK